MFQRFFGGLSDHDLIKNDRWKEIENKQRWPKTWTISRRSNESTHTTIFDSWRLEFPSRRLPLSHRDSLACDPYEIRERWHLEEIKMDE